MDVVITIANQIIIMFLLMGVGVFLERRKAFSPQTVKELNSFLITVVVMAAIVTAFQTEYQESFVRNLFVGLIIGAIAHLIGIVLATAIFGKKTLENRLSIFGSVYSNSTFMGLPLVTAVFGAEGTFYAAIYVAVFSTFIWSHGASLVDGDNTKTIKERAFQIIKNPVILSAIFGMFCYITNIRFPVQISNVIGYVASLNTPLAMILLGIFMAKCNIFEAIKNVKIYKVTILRLIIIPLTFLLVMKVLMMFFVIESNMVLAILISVSCPTAGTMAMMSERFDVDTSYAIQTITLCTIASLATIPLIMMIAQAII